MEMEGWGWGTGCSSDFQDWGGSMASSEPRASEGIRGGGGFSLTNRKKGLPGPSICRPWSIAARWSLFKGMTVSGVSRQRKGVREKKPVTGAKSSS